MSFLGHLLRLRHASMAPCALGGLLLLGGCVAAPTIDASRVAAPKSIALVDIPSIRNMAVIDVITPFAPGARQFHFSERADRFFDLPGVAGMPATGTYTLEGGLIGAMIMNKGAATQKKAMEEFSGEVTSRHPGFDLRADFMNALRDALQARGVAVSLIEDARGKAPRLRWPAMDRDGNRYPAEALDSTPPVDADIVLQVSPIAIYNSPGPLNAYKRNVTVGIALFNGRTRQFLGRQTLRFVAPDSRFEYYDYEGLVKALPEAAPALRAALLSLVNQTADVATGRPSRP